jgi:hypothetical protein
MFALSEELKNYLFLNVPLRCNSVFMTHLDIENIKMILDNIFLIYVYMYISYLK